MKVASIDIGTNSMRLLIAEYQEKFLSRNKWIQITRMGQGVDKNGYFTPETIERNIAALQVFSQQVREQKVDFVEIIGTSALRDSKNKEEFLERAQKETGLNVCIVSGTEEALLGFRGVLLGLDKEEKILVMDIGGGSTEFIVGSANEGILFAKSIDIGALRLTERFVKKDPLTEEEKREIQSYCQEKIEELKDKILKLQPSVIIGVGGTITSVSAMVQKLQEYKMDKIHNSFVTSREIEGILKELLSKNLEARKQMPGLDPKRADIITAGVLILSTVLETLNFDPIRISDFDNLEGVLYQKIKG